MKKSFGVVLATAVLALSSACGGSASDSSGPVSGDAKQVGATAGADRSPSDAPLTRENFVERLSAAQVEAGSAHLDMTTSAAGMDVAMAGDVSLDKDLEKSATRLEMDLGAMQFEVRLVGGIMYLNMGEMSGGKFVEIDLQDPDNPMVGQFGSSIEQLDPAQQMATFDKALVDFDNEGDGGQMDGVETTRLRLVVDTRKMLGDQATAGRAGAKMPEKVEYVLYIGQDDDLMRQMTVDVGGSATSIDWSRWGEDVSVEAPKKSEITDAPAFPFPTAGAIAG